jgi:hypothetical protein
MHLHRLAVRRNGPDECHPALEVAEQIRSEILRNARLIANRAGRARQFAGDALPEENYEMAARRFDLSQGVQFLREGESQWFPTGKRC